MPPRGVHTPTCPPYSCASVCSQRLLHVVGDCKGPPYMLDTSFTPPPVWGCFHFRFYPHPFVGFPVHWYVLGISVCYMGNISLMLGVWGVPPSVGGFGGINTWGVHMVILVHSCSSLCLTFLLWLWLLLLQLSGVIWAVICFFSDCGSFLDGASRNIGVAWSGSTTTLDAERLQRCYWPCLCATAATSIFDASSGLWQLWVLHR